MPARPAHIVIAAAILLCRGAPADVLIVGASSDPECLAEIREKLDQTGILDGHAIGTFDLVDSTPTPELLSLFDAVLTFTDSPPVDPVPWGDRLADYADAGGGVVQMTFSWNIGPGGRWFDDGYSPFIVGEQSEADSIGIGAVHCPGHPVLEGVAAFDGGTSSFHNTGDPSPGALRIADWENGVPFAAEVPGFASRIVGLNFFPPSSDCRGDFWDASTDGAILMANAAAYVMTDPGPIPALSRGLTVNRGVRTRGNARALQASDDRSVELESEGGRRQRTRLTLRLQAACPDAVQLDLRIETGADAGGIITRAQMFDFQAQRWRLIEKFDQTRGDRSRLFEAVDEPGRFIKPNGLMRVRVSSVRKGGPYTLRHDQIEVGLAPLIE